MHNVSFSIVIPAYKSVYLVDAIKSVLNQTYRNFELIIVDDASPNPIFLIVNEFNDPRIRYYRNEKNCGAVNVVDNWNICLSYAKGEYVICMGDDDRLLPNCLEEYAKLIEKYPDLGVYHAWTELIDEQSNFLTLQQPRPEYETALSLAWNRWNGRNRQYIGDFCFNIQQLREAGGFYKNPLAWASDDITAIRAAIYKGIANTQTICFQYRVNSRTITNTGSSRTKIEAILQEEAWFETFIGMQQNRNVSLSPLDNKYLACLIHELPQHFKAKLKYEIICDLRLRKLDFFRWLYNRHRYGLNGKDILICLFKSIK